MIRFLGLTAICAVTIVGCSREQADASRDQAAANMPADSSGDSAMDEPITFDVYTDFI